MSWGVKRVLPLRMRSEQRVVRTRSLYGPFQLSEMHFPLLNLQHVGPVRRILPI